MGLLVVMGVDLCDLSLGRPMIQRIALYVTLGLTLDLIGADAATLGFWCVLALFWAMDTLSNTDGFETGVVAALQMPLEQIQELQAELAKIEQEDTKD